MSVQTDLPHASVKLSTSEADQLGLDATVSAWVPPIADEEIVLELNGDGTDGVKTRSTAQLSPAEARNLAMQLLASAAAIDDTVPKGPPGYLTE